MNETDQAEKDRRYARIDALTDRQRRELIDYLCGYAPKGVDRWLDEFGGDAGGSKP